MHRYEELEKVYYKKLFLKLFIIGISFIFIIILIVTSLFKREAKQVNTSHKENINKQKEENRLTFIKKDSITKENKYIISFIVPKINETMNKKNYFQPMKKEDKKDFVKKTTKSKTEIENKKNIDTLKIQILEEKTSISTLINKFNKNPSYDLANIIASYYYKHKDYKNAKKWVLKANSLFPSDADSWILFSDILLKLGDKKKAKAVLEVYLDQYGDNDKVISKLRSFK